jgi:tetratricopeptide (TPR) repeat protein
MGENDMELQDTGPSELKLDNDVHMPAGGLKTHKLEIADRTGKDEFLGHLDQMAKDARARQGAETAELQLPEFEIEEGVVSKEFEAESKLAKLLKEAKAYIVREEFKKALRPLAALLKESPRHHEGLYLTAFCQYGLKDPMAALRALVPLRTVNLESRLATRVRALRERIRSVLFLKVLLKNQLLVLAERYDEAIKEVRELVQVDPEVWLYHFLLGGALMKAGRHKEALAALNAGIAACNASDHAQLLQLKRMVGVQLATAQMTPARALYKTAKYGKARAKLRRLDDTCRATRVWQMFDDYLGQLDSGTLGFLKSAKKPSDAKPSGSAEEAESLYQFLVEEEMKQAILLMKREQFARAQPVAQKAVYYAPGYPFAHFLYSSAIYKGLEKKFLKKSPPPPEEAVVTLEKVLKHARFAVRDRDIKQAPGLVQVAERLLQEFAKVRKKLEQRKKDAKLVNAAIEEFHSIMEDSKKVDSVEGYENLDVRLRSLARELPGIRRRVHGTEAKKATDELKKAVQRNLEQLERILHEVGKHKKEAKLVNDAGQEFQEIMKDAEKNPAQLDSIHRRLKSLSGRLPGIRRRVHSAKACEAVDMLKKAVQRNLDQLDSLGEDAKVAPLIQRFNMMMEGITKMGGLSDRDMIMTVKTFFETLKSDCQSTRRAISQSSARKKLDELISAIDKVLKQFP